MRVKLGVLLCGALCAAALVLPGAAGAALDFAGPAYTNTSGPPTTSKPESKLWFHDGFWWASTYNKSQGAYTIHRLNKRTLRWKNTTVVIDGRDGTRQDVLSLGNRLFIASHKYRSKKAFQPGLDLDDGMKLHRFTYNGSSYGNRTTTNVDPANPQRAESLVIAQGSNGAVWATWVQQDGVGGDYKVFVKKTADDCVGTGSCAFEPTGVLGGGDPVSPDDISSIVSLGGGDVGVMWSDSPDQMKFSVHSGGAWGPVELAADGPKLGEDHINLKAAGGIVYAAVKTKFNRRPTNPGIRLLVRRPGGNWSGHQVTNASFRYTRPIVLLQGSRVRVFADRGGDAVFMKTARKSTLRFGSGGGKRVLDAGNPTSMKQNLSARTQMIVVGSDHDARRYRHMYTQLSNCVRSGTAGNDRICGNRRNNRLNGYAGNDVILGRGGRDRLVGGSGRDRLVGGSGKDTFLARDRTRDVLKGGSGRDRARVDRRLDRRRSIERLF